MQGSSRKTGFDFLFNLAGAIVPTLVALVTVPIYVHQIGPARYGIVAVVWLLLGYFGFLDLGLSRASANSLSRIDPADRERRSAVLITAAILNLAMGALGGLVLLVFGEFLFGRVMNVPAELLPEVRAVIPWIATLLPLSLLAGVANGALESRDRFLLANILQVGGGTVGQVAPVLAAIWISPSLTVVVPVAVAARAAAVLVTLVGVVRMERPTFAIRFDRGRARDLLGYGGWITVSSIVSPILTSLDQIIIGSRLGVAAVAYYAVPMNLVTRSQVLAAALSRTLFPTMSRLDSAAAKTLSEEAVVTLAAGYAAMCAPAILLAGPLLSLWIGAEFTRTAGPVAELLLIGAWINGLAFVPFGLLQAQGRPDLTAKFHLLELGPFLGILWLLTTHFGLLGAAAAWSLRMAVDAGLLFAATRLGRAALVRLALLLLPLLASYGLAQAVAPDLALRFALAVLVFAVSASLAMAADPNARRLVLASLRAIRHAPVFTHAGK